MDSSNVEINSPEEVISVESDGEDKMSLDAYIAEVEKKVSVYIAQGEDEAYGVYRDYANLIGFSVRKGKQYYVSGTTIIRSKTYYCSKEGVKDERPRTNGTRMQSTSRTDCKAMITFDVDKNGLWKVGKFIKEHNHELAPSNSRHLLRSSRFISVEKGATIESMKNAGLRSIDCFNYMTEECQGVQRVGFSKKDCYNFINMLKTSLIEPGDAQNLVRYFKNKANVEPGFYFDIQFNQEGRMANAFWRDNKCKLDYECFGDLVVFDTTYRTNKYNLVCGPFIGVNHHWQNVMFGCAFLSDETTESFNWLFTTFLESMDNKAPVSMFTDQDQAMTNAIASVFPDTRHRLCLWHISKNAPSHLNSFNSSRDFHSLFNKCLYHCETKDEFEQTWEKMLDKYDAHGHSWLGNLYKIRDKWSVAFNSDYFHGGVRSTSRSESTNHALNEISSKTISLSEFVLKFDKYLLEKWRRNEADEDFVSSQSNPPIVVRYSKILNHAIKVYTSIMYKEFEKDYLIGTGALSCKEIPIGDTLYEFEFTNPEINSDRVYTVMLDIDSLKVECSCKKFTWMRMLCSHALAALHRKNIHEIPQSYIDNRWTKDAKKQVYMTNEDDFMKMDENEARAVYTNRTMRLAYDLVSRSGSCKEARDMLWRVLKDGAQRLDKILKKDDLDSTLTVKGKRVRNDYINLSNDRQILDPLPIKSKGSKNARIKSHFEKRKSKSSNTGKSKKQSMSTSNVSSIATPVSYVPMPNQFVQAVSSNLHVNTYIDGVTNNTPQIDSLVDINYVIPEAQQGSSSVTNTMHMPQSFTSMMQAYSQMNNLTKDSGLSNWRPNT